MKNIYKSVLFLFLFALTAPNMASAAEEETFDAFDYLGDYINEVEEKPQTAPAAPTAEQTTESTKVSAETTTEAAPKKQADAAESSAADTDYLNNYITDVIDEKETVTKARSSARQILQNQPEILKLRTNDLKALNKAEELKKEIEEQKKEEMEQALSPEKKLEQLKSQFVAAPLGLYWGASQEEIRKFGFELKQAERENYKSVYMVLNPQQKNKTFREIFAIFGVQDKLWCIFAQSTPQEDDAQASKVLALYHRYYEALAKKYGNPQEYFMPYSYEEQLIEGEGPKKTVTTVQKQNPLGGADFLNELKEGKAVLYATFKSDTIGVTLGVSVDGDNQSYISIDYKDFALMDSEQQTALKNTIEDL